MPTDDVPGGRRGEGSCFFDMIEESTTAARHRLVEVLARAADCGGEARDILRLGNAAALLTAAGRGTGSLPAIAAIDLYVEIARGEQASLFGPVPAASREAADIGISGIIAAELDDLAFRLSRDSEPARLFGLFFAIERARHLMFVSRPAAFALPRSSGRRLALAATLHPALTTRLAALMNAVAATIADRELILAQAHASHDVIERVVRAWVAACPPALASADPFARRPGLRAI